MYQALYRKYRPQTFSDVVGQKSVTDTLRNQLQSGKLSHAYLFTGTRGTGKTTCAKILAKAANCTNLQDGNPCNCCPSCRAIDAGSCMDVLEIDAASNNGVDSVRALRDDAIYTPSEVKMRVYIIDEVHMLSMSAFNALLKIIEEPPEHLLFILATTELHKVPATILSRCQRFAFRRLSMDDIAARLNFIAYQEHIEITSDAIHLLSRLADGALRDGVSLLDQCASASGGTVTEENIYQTLGLAGEHKAAELLCALAEKNPAGALKIFSEQYTLGKDVSAMIGELSALCRDLLILKTAPKCGIGMMSGAASEADLAALAEKISGAELLRDLELLQVTRASLVKNTDTRVAMELCLLQMSQPELTLNLQAINARLGRVEEQLAAGFVPAKVSASVTEEPDERPPWPDDADDPYAAQIPQELQAEKSINTPAQPEKATAFWPELSEKIRAALSPRNRGFFDVNSSLEAIINGDTLILAAESDFVLNMIHKPETEQIIRDKASAFFGKPIAVRFTLKNQVNSAGADPMDALVRNAQGLPEIFTVQ